MRFALIDRILEIEPRERLVGLKAVSLAEEYLADHFPTFPVLPGVLMLQAMVEAASWLVWSGGDFTASMVLLRETRSVTYKSFVKPGRLLRVEVVCRRLARGESDFTGACSCGDEEMAKGRFGLVHFNLADKNPALAHTDEMLTAAARRNFALLTA